MFRFDKADQMKIVSLILIILGWLLLAFNLLGYLAKGPHLPEDTGTVNTVAFYIGYNLFLILGIIFLIVGYKLKRKAKNKRASKDLMANFLTDKPED